MTFSSSAQDNSAYQVRLQSGSFTPEKNITSTAISSINQRAARVNATSFVLIQFNQVPTAAQRKLLSDAGIELLDYIPSHAYTATVKGNCDLNLLKQVDARSIVELSATQKMHPQVASGNFPGHAVRVQGTVDVWISFPGTFTYQTVVAELTSKNFDINDIQYGHYRIIGVRVPTQRLQELALLPIVEYVQAAPREAQLLNNKAVVNGRANVITSSLGRNLNGSGVVIGIGDNADPNNHIDFAGRFINRNPITGGNHGQHVMGTAAGAGNLNEKFTGYAPKATILSQYVSNLLNSIPAYVQDHHMVITNNSYGLIVDDCSSFGIYDLYSRILDQQAADHPNLQQVFSSGNSGDFGLASCSKYPRDFGTVLGSYQSAKNVVTVGNTIETGTIFSASSKGPVFDGRIKPEIVAQGTAVWSAGFGSYWSNTGTSMSAPAVSGGLALLYQRYRQLHGNIDPKNGLIKALLCNGGTDLGRPGPDYIYGFGWMNLLRSTIMMENNNYVNTSIGQGGTNDRTLNISGNNIAQLKVMLYWNDTAGSVLTRQALVNDLDLEIIDPSSNVHLPFILDTVPARVDSAAIPGVDRINNIEQVVINNPVAGNYILRVKGTAINQNPVQEYFLVFDTVPVSTTLTYPIGRERLFPGDSVYISWDAWGAPASSFTLEYLKDDATGWTTINNNVPGGSRLYKWFVPANDTSDESRVRITNNSTATTSTSERFTILGPDTVTVLPLQFQCEGYIRINWTKVARATDYEVMILRGGEMVPVGITVDTNYSISGLSKDTLYYVSVRPRLNGSPGRRSIAVSRQPNNGNCDGTISDNDLKMEAILSPVSSGRLLTSTALSNSVAVTVRVKNLDNTPSISNIDLTYRVNGGTLITQTIIAPTIAAGSFFDYTFPSTLDLSGSGTYVIEAGVIKTSDPVGINNTITKTFKQLINPPITISDLPWTDNFETLPVQSITVDQLGLDGSDRYDFYNSTQYGRLRSFVNTGIAYSGNRALTLDIEKYVAVNNIDSLTGTFNLATFNASTDDIRLDFRYKNHGQLSSAANRVWIRGNDTQNWLQVYDLYANQLPAEGAFKLTVPIELSDTLIKFSQNFSSSFQVRIGQIGAYLTTDDYNRSGYTFDDIRLYRAIDDIEMIRIDTPVAASCALNSAVPVRIEIRNTSNSTVTNIPVVLRVDGIIIATETIASIAANTTILYTFNPGVANLATPGNHTIEVWSQLATDSYPINDTTRSVIVNAPIISSFPYLENFESGVGSWYAAGKNSTWEFGTPNSIKINGAASGSKAWKTSLQGYYRDNERSYLYSPCYDLTGIPNPTLSFSLALNIEECSSLCDGAWMEYSLNGVTWTKLGAYGQGTNWYNRNYSGNHVWSEGDTSRWHVATIGLPTTNNSRLQLRFVMSADAGLSKEGIAVDDIHIYSNPMGIYDGGTMGSPVTQTIAGGTGWIDFTSVSGKLIASIQPNNQALGSTSVQAYIHGGAVRNHNSQYYHNRNITIKPTTTALADSAIVRFYFLDSETEALIAATGCGTCTKPMSAYGLGVSKYSDPNDAVEDGDISNSLGSYWSFINATKATKVPFDKGYYAEFRVKNFSEFWLNNGGFDNNHALPLELVSFTANKVPSTNDVLVAWKTASETDVDRFEIEMARGYDDFRQNRFGRIGVVRSQGNSATLQQYSFGDVEPGKYGVRYYRLKMIDLDGTFTYSAIRSLVFTDEVKWQVYPNPSKGVFNLMYQQADGERMHVKVYDAAGRVVYRSNAVSNGFVQKIQIDLTGASYAQGMYMVEAEAGGVKKTFSVVKQ